MYGKHWYTVTINGGDKTNLELGALCRPTFKLHVGAVFSRPLGCCVARRKKKEVPNLPWASPGREWHPRLVHLCGYPRIPRSMGAGGMPEWQTKCPSPGQFYAPPFFVSDSFRRPPFFNSLIRRSRRLVMVAGLFECCLYAPTWAEGNHKEKWSQCRLWWQPVFGTTCRRPKLAKETDPPKKKNTSG